MKKDLTRLVGILIIILFFSYFVYPTPTYYTHALNDQALIKINRFTGETYFLDISGRQWIKINK